MARWWGIASLGLLTGLCLSPSPVGAAGPGCAPTREMRIVPTIEVVPEIANPQYRYDANRAQLAAIMAKSGGNGSRHSVLMGLTVASYNATMEVASASVRNGNVFCHYLQSARVRLQMPSLTVYVASEYRRGSCPFQTITAHENEHVRIDQSVLRKYAPILKEALTTAVYRISPIANSSNQGARALEQALLPAASAIILEMNKERDRNNGAIDTDDAYRKTAKRCNSW